MYGEKHLQWDIIETDASLVIMQHLPAFCTNLKLHIFINASAWILCLLIVFSFTPHQC